MKDNSELLAWAVENIEVWGETVGDSPVLWTHLRISDDGYPFNYTVGDWEPRPKILSDRLYWTPVDEKDNFCESETIQTRADYSNFGLQVISDEEWREAKKAKYNKRFVECDSGVMISENNQYGVLVSFEVEWYCGLPDLRVPHESWGLLGKCQDLITWLSKHSDTNITVQDLVDALKSMGYEDKTHRDEEVNQHE